MQPSWSITAEWEQLNVGSSAERAAFAAIGIKANGLWLTEGNDALANRLRQAPLLSAYHLAEWFAWNWWRLRWEPRSHSKDWAFSHRMSTIGAGYIWPNITIFSDGERTALIANSTAERQQTPFRYIADHAVVLPAGLYEAGLDTFIEQVIQRLDWASIRDSNLNQIWESVSEERRNPKLARTRKLQALLGQDPDDAEEIVENLIADSGLLGSAGVEEIAAEYGQSGKIHTVEELKALALRSGFDTSPSDHAKLPAEISPQFDSQIPAAKVGARAAQALRAECNLGEAPLSNEKLAELAGASSRAISDRRDGSDISFVLDESRQKGHVVLRSKWETGRRFELARLLGDRLVRRGTGKLHAATRSYTYRQKFQRAFAAEFLSPWENVVGMLNGDFSVESQQDVAEYFSVSPLTIATMLVNHGRVAREELEADFDSMVA